MITKKHFYCIITLLICSTSQASDQRALSKVAETSTSLSTGPSVKELTSRLANLETEKQHLITQRYKEPFFGSINKGQATTLGILAGLVSATALFSSGCGYDISDIVATFSWQTYLAIGSGIVATVSTPFILVYNINQDNQVSEPVEKKIRKVLAQMNPMR